MWYNVFKIVSNRYFLATVFFIVWLSFFDNNSLIVQSKLSSQLNGMKNEMKFYETEIEKYQQTIRDLNGDTKTLEKFAREKYLMKKDNEDVFVVVKEKED